MILSMFIGGWLLAGSGLADGLPVAAWATQAPIKTQAAQGLSAPTPPNADAYYQFLLGRHFESEGDADAAIAAYKEAVRLDPKSPAIQAELGGAYARQNRVREAIDAADAALGLDPDNAEAHRVLGIVYASLARVEDPSTRADSDSKAYAAKAVAHLEAARKTTLLPQSGMDLMLGRLYLRTGEAEKAIGLLTPVVTDEAGRPEPVELLLQAYAQAGRSDDVVKLLEATVAEQPQFYPMLGEAYERQQRWNDAAEAYEKGVARNPKSLELKTRLAIALLSGGDATKSGRALSVLEQVRQANPGDSRVLYLLSQAQRTAGKLDDSEKTARELLAVAPASLTGPYALALVLEQKQQYRQVVAVLEPAVAKPPNRGASGIEITPLFVHLGFAYVELADYDKAVATFERARASSPGNTAIDIYVMQAHLAARRYPAVIEAARAWLAAHPGDQRVLRLQSEALRQTGQGDEGARLLTGALDSHRGDVSAYLALAEYYMQVGRLEPAARVLREAQEQFPSNLTVTFQLGAVYERGKRFADAERTFRQVLAKDPLHAQALNYLGYMLADRGDRLDESLGYIKRALRTDPYNGAYLDSLGWVYFKLNKLGLAETNLRQAAEQRVRDSAVQDHLGDLLFKLGRYREAASAWKRALEGDGEQIDKAAIDRKLRSALDRAEKQ
ncbi:MAG TPA: tetratricopeptide repeat protein [Vicinamibacterales bacterium]|jgi:tetratricopeptide (TPR) repeat protein